MTTTMASSTSTIPFREELEPSRLKLCSKVKSLGRALVSAVLLGRWENVAVSLISLAKALIALALQIVVGKKKGVQAWLASPVLAGGSLPTPWTRLELPLGPIGRSVLLMLRRIRRWHAAVCIAGTTFMLYRWLRRTSISSSINFVKQRRALLKQAKAAEDYPEWLEAARALHAPRARGPTPCSRNGAAGACPS